MQWRLGTTFGEHRAATIRFSTGTDEEKLNGRAKRRSIQVAAAAAIEKALGGFAATKAGEKIIKAEMLDDIAAMNVMKRWSVNEQIQWTFDGLRRRVEPKTITVIDGSHTSVTLNERAVGTVMTSRLTGKNYVNQGRGPETDLHEADAPAAAPTQESKCGPVPLTRSYGRLRGRTPENVRWQTGIAGIWF